MADFFKKTSMSVNNGARFIANIPLKILYYVFTALSTIFYILGRWFVVLPVMFFLVFQNYYFEAGYTGFDVGGFFSVIPDAVKTQSFRGNAILAIVFSIVIILAMYFLKKFFGNLAVSASYHVSENKNVIRENNEKISYIEKKAGNKDLSEYNKGKADDFKSNKNFVER